MINFMLESANLPFAVALAVMLLIAIIEGVGALLGFALSGLLDNLMPDLEFDVDAADVADHGAFGEFLTWLRLREVPVIVVLIAFLTSFSITGLLLQQVTDAVLGFLWPAFVAAMIAIVLCVPGVRVFAGILGKIMPKDETEAVSKDSFIGRTVTLTLGTASVGEPAEGKLKDQHGYSHYLMVEPDMQEDIFEQGAKLLIVRREGGVFFAISDPNAETIAN